MTNSVFDVAEFAERKCNINYNAFINLMEKSKIIPFYERKVLEIYKDVGKDYGWSQEVTDVFNKYIEENGSQILTD